MVEEKTACYSQRYLVAIEEVETASGRNGSMNSCSSLCRSSCVSPRQRWRESRNRYVQGMTDYIPVLTALVAFQKLEMNILQRQLEKVSYRLHLYRALGTNILSVEQDALVIDN